MSRRDVAVMLHEDERMCGLGQVVGIFLDELFEGGAHDHFGTSPGPWHPPGPSCERRLHYARQ